MSYQGASTSVEGSVMHVARNKAACVEWKIPNFLDLPHSNMQCIESSRFVLSDAKWFIRIYPNESDAHIYIYILKTCSPRLLRVSYSMEVLKVDGSIFKSLHNIEVFQKEECFSSDLKFSSSEIFGDRNVVLSEGTLTIICSISILDEIAKCISMEVACQTQFLASFETLSKDFKELFLSRSKGDVSFKVKDRDFLVHKLVLSTRSRVFEAMFETDMVEKNNGTVDILDSNPEHFEKFLLYLYSGDLNVVSSSNALELYMLADKYNLKELKETCCELLSREITVDSFCDIAVLAHLHDESKLLKAATVFFIEHAKLILPTPNWATLNAEHFTLANEFVMKKMGY